MTLDIFFIALATSLPSCLLSLTASLSSFLLDLGPFVGGLYCATATPDSSLVVISFSSFYLISAFLSCLNFENLSALSFKLTEEAESSTLERFCDLSFFGRYISIPEFAYLPIDTRGFTTYF
jgi:hypothetical protein